MKEGEYIEFEIKLPFTEEDIAYIEYKYESSNDGDRSTKIITLKDGRVFQDGMEVHKYTEIDLNNPPPDHWLFEARKKDKAMFGYSDNVWTPLGTVKEKDLKTKL